MSIQLIGGEGVTPFDRTFFNTKLGDYLEQGRGPAHKVTLHLQDGTTLDLCKLDELTEGYLAVRAYQGHADSCDLSVHLIPYGLIYKIEIAPKAESHSGQVGFAWAPPARKSHTTKRTK